MKKIKISKSLSLIFIISVFCFYTGGKFVRAQEHSIETVIQTGHYASVTAVSYSPDGKLAVTGSKDKTIKLWEVSTGREIRSYLGHSGSIVSLSFSPNGKYLVSVSSDKTAKIWEVYSSKEVKTFSFSDDKVISADFSPDGKYLVTGGSKTNATLWEVESGKKIKSFTAKPEDLRIQKNFLYKLAQSVNFSPDGKYLLTGSNDRTAILYEVSTGNEIQKFKGDRYSCTTCFAVASFSPDGKYIAAGHSDSLKLWEVSTGREIRAFEGRRGRYSSINFSLNGKYLAAICVGNAKLWDVSSGKEIQHFTGHLKNVNSIKLSPDGKYVITGSDDRTARIWKVSNGKEVLTFKGYLNEIDDNILNDRFMYWVALVNEVKLSPDGKFIAIGQTGNNAKLMEFSTGRVIKTFKGHSGMVVCLSFSPDGKYLATGSVDGSAKVWNVATGEEINTFQVKGTERIIFSIGFSPDGKYLVTGGWDGVTRIWDITTGKMDQSIYAHNGVSSYFVSFTPSGLYVLSSGLDRTLKLFEIDTGKEIRNFIGHTNVVASISISPDGKYMLTGSWDKMAKLWDIPTGMQIRRFTGHTGAIHAVSFDSTGRCIVTGSDDNTAKLWDALTGKEIRTFIGHSGAVSSVHISPSGKYLITGSRDGTIKTWNLETGKELLTHIFIGETDWLVKTPEGFFDASEGAKNSIFFVKGTEIFNVDQFFEEFYRPGLLNEVYRSRSTINQNLNLLDRIEQSPPPTVEIIVPEPGTKFNNSEIMVLAKITNRGGGIDEVKLLHNGKSLPVDNSDVKRVRKKDQYIMKTLNVSLVPGDNTLSVSAFSEGRIESEMSETKLYYKGTEKTASCYLISIGINKYQNPNLELNYAKADARDFGKIILEKGQKLFKKIELHELYDKQATKNNIFAKLDELAGKVKPGDVFFFYYAGHGSMVENKFFFIPTENVSLYQLEKLTKESIYAGDMQEKFKNIKALKQLILIDACQSGGSAKLLAQRGAMEEKALAQMSRSSGVHVLAAAGREQSAVEFGSLGHGLFTYVLLEALKGEADGAPKDGKVTIYELKSYLDDQVPELSNKFKGQTQYPYTFSRGHDFPLVIE